MNINNNNKNDSRKGLKIFFIKLTSISIAILILINLIFNLLFAERLKKQINYYYWRKMNSDMK